LRKGGPRNLDRFSAKLSYNSVVEVMPLISFFRIVLLKVREIIDLIGPVIIIF